MRAGKRHARDALAVVGRGGDNAGERGAMAVRVGLAVRAVEVAEFPLAAAEDAFDEGPFEGAPLPLETDEVRLVTALTIGESAANADAATRPRTANTRATTSPLRFFVRPVVRAVSTGEFPFPVAVALSRTPMPFTPAPPFCLC